MKCQSTEIKDFYIHLYNKEKALNNEDLSNSENIEDITISKQFFIEEQQNEFDHDKQGDEISFSEFANIIQQSKDQVSDSNKSAEEEPNDDLFAEFNVLGNTRDNDNRLNSSQSNTEPANLLMQNPVGQESHVNYGMTINEDDNFNQDDNRNDFIFVKDEDEKITEQSIYPSDRAELPISHEIKNLLLDDDHSHHKPSNEASDFDYSDIKTNYDMPVFKVIINESRQVKDNQWSTFTEYKIETEFWVENTKKSTMFSFHRLKDFQKLSDHLNKTQDSIIIDALPDKSFYKNDSDTISFRKRFLGDWLNKVLNHNVLVKDKFLKVFVEQDGSSDVFKNQNGDNSSFTSKTLKRGSELMSSCFDMQSKYLLGNANDNYDLNQSNLFKNQYDNLKISKENLSSAKSDLENIDRQAQKLSQYLKKFSEKIELYSNSDSKMESKDYLKNKDYLNSFNEIILKITDKYLYEIILLSKNHIISNIKNLEGNLVKLTNRRDKVKKVKNLENEISEINMKTQQDLTCNLDEDRNKLMADKSKILKELEISRGSLITEIKSNNIHRLENLNGIFSIYKDFTFKLQHEMKNQEDNEISETEENNNLVVTCNSIMNDEIDKKIDDITKLNLEHFPDKNEIKEEK